MTAYKRSAIVIRSQWTLCPVDAPDLLSLDAFDERVRSLWHQKKLFDWCPITDPPKLTVGTNDTKLKPKALAASLSRHVQGARLLRPICAKTSVPTSALFDVGRALSRHDLVWEISKNQWESVDGKTVFQSRLLRRTGQRRLFVRVWGLDRSLLSTHPGMLRGDAASVVLAGPLDRMTHDIGSVMMEPALTFSGLGREPLRDEPLFG